MLASLFVVPTGIEDCLVAGVCWIARAPVGPPPGLMFLAVGLVFLGLVGFSARR